MEAGATLRNARSEQRCNLVLRTRATRGPLMLLLESLIPQPPPPPLLLLLVVLPTLLHHSPYTPTPPQNGKTSSSSSRRTLPSSRALPVRHLDGEKTMPPVPSLSHAFQDKTNHSQPPFPQY
ncbi:unnamed protein product [Ectocarpus sp. 12 AP-2014]